MGRGEAAPEGRAAFPGDVGGSLGVNPRQPTTRAATRTMEMTRVTTSTRASRLDRKHEQPAGWDAQVHAAAVADDVLLRERIERDQAVGLGAAAPHRAAVRIQRIVDADALDGEVVRAT